MHSGWSNSGRSQASLKNKMFSQVPTLLPDVSTYPWQIANAVFIIWCFVLSNCPTKNSGCGTISRTVDFNECEDGNNLTKKIFYMTFCYMLALSILIGCSTFFNQSECFKWALSLFILEIIFVGLGSGVRIPDPVKWSLIEWTALQHAQIWI